MQGGPWKQAEKTKQICDSSIFTERSTKADPFGRDERPLVGVEGVDVDVAAHTMRPGHQMTHDVSGLFLSMACRLLGKITP